MLRTYGPFSDSHSTPWQFIDPLDGPIDPWGSISTTLRTTALNKQVQCAANRVTPGYQGNLHNSGSSDVTYASNPTAGPAQKDSPSPHPVYCGPLLCMAVADLANFIVQGTRAATGLSEVELNKRRKIDAAKRQKLRNPNVFVSQTRLCVHNIPRAVDNTKLRASSLLFSIDRFASDIRTTLQRRLRCVRALSRATCAGVSCSGGAGCHARLPSLPRLR